jgi:hypothetical protein
VRASPPQADPSLRERTREQQAKIFEEFTPVRRYWPRAGYHPQARAPTLLAITRARGCAVPVSALQIPISTCPTGCEQSQQTNSLFDHLVGAGEHRLRNFEAERFRS